MLSTYAPSAVEPVETPATPAHGIRTAWLLMVMPRSRSMSMRSRYWARMSRSLTMPVMPSMRSARVDLPWSMWAMMQKLRMNDGAVDAGCRAVEARGDIWWQFSHSAGLRFADDAAHGLFELRMLELE